MVSPAEFTYVHIWPIADRNRPLSALITEACRDLDIMAALAGGKIVGEPSWAVSPRADRLVCMASARPWSLQEQWAARGRLVPLHFVNHIRRLALNHVPQRAIAQLLGLPESTIRYYSYYAPGDRP